MTSTINASSTGSGGIVQTADASGVLALQANGTTAFTVNSDATTTFANAATLSGGTANGVTYLNGSKVLTSGSAFVFDGTNVGIGTSSPSKKLEVANSDALIYGITVGRGAGAVATNTTVGTSALVSNTSGANNSAFGTSALRDNTTGSNNTALGYQALLLSTTASNNTAVGYQAGYNNTSGSGSNAFFGTQAGYSNTIGGRNTYIGMYAGYNANLTTGDAGNTYVGYQAGNLTTTGAANTFVGGNGSSQLGAAGYSVTTGSFNTLLGVSSGYYITTGSKNTVLGSYNGNQGGLDIRTASNYIVLSDGDGNPRGIFDGSGNFLVGTTSVGGRATIYGGTGQIVGSFRSNETAATYCQFVYNAVNQIGTITGTTTSVAYNTSSDQRLKENIQDAESASALIDALQVRQFDWKIDNSHQRYGFVAQELVTVAPEAVHQPVNEEEMMAVDYSKLVPMLVKAHQEQQALITSLTARIEALESR